MKIKTVNRVIHPETHKSENAYRVKIGKRDYYDKLIVNISHEKLGLVGSFEFDGKEIAPYESIHFKAEEHNGEIKINWVQDFRELKQIEEMESYEWTEWKSFPDPRKGDFLIAPFGCGVYQLRNKLTNEYILFGKGKHLAQRMTSLLPKPHGCGTRNNVLKRTDVLDNIENIEYRTVAFTSETEMKNCEDVLKCFKIHKHNQ